MKMATSGSNSSNMSTAKSKDQEQSPCTSSELCFHRFQRDQSPVSQLGCSQSCFSSNLGRSSFYTTDNKSSNKTSSSSVPTAVTCSISRPQVDLDACNLFPCNFQQSRSRNCESLVYHHSEDQQCLALQSPDDLQYLVNFHIYNRRNDQSYQLPQPQNCTKPAVLSKGHKHSKKYLNTKLEKGSSVSRDEAEFDANPRGNSISSTAAISNKRRLKWTPHLHNQFLECVNRLGGAERAKPKLILKLMDVEGLTIFHIKSHLQKCRITKYIAESKEGKSEKNNFDTMPVHDLNTGKLIAEAYCRTLQMQLNVHKRLLQQLEMQRSLQMNIEEQGRQLKQLKCFLEQRLHNKNSAPHSDPPTIYNF